MYLYSDNFNQISLFVVVYSLDTVLWPVVSLVCTLWPLNVVYCAHNTKEILTVYCSSQFVCVKCYLRITRINLSITVVAVAAAAAPAAPAAAAVVLSLFDSRLSSLFTLSLCLNLNCINFLCTRRPGTKPIP